MSSNLLIRKFLSVSAWQARPRPDTFSLLLTLIARVPVKSSGLACYSMVQRNSAAVVRHDASTRNQRLHFGLKLWHCVIRYLRIQVRLHGQMGLASCAAVVPAAEGSRFQSPQSSGPLTLRMYFNLPARCVRRTHKQD